MGKKVKVKIEQSSDRYGATKHPWGFYGDNRNGRIVVFPNFNYQDLPAGSTIWAEIINQHQSEPVIYARPITINGKPYSNKRH